MFDLMSNYVKQWLLISASVIAFACNSILCRLALSDVAIDASSFTALRLSSGALTLAIIIKVLHPSARMKNNYGWKAPVLLFVYAYAFSLSYTQLDSSVGAVILFGFVQIALIGLACIKCKNVNRFNIAGIIIAFLGLVYLIKPTAQPFSSQAAILMAVAGVAWGFYTFLLKESNDSLAATASHFSKTIPMLVIIVLVNIDKTFVTSSGVFLAMISGSITSAMGYVLWDFTVKQISLVHAALSQLMVPIVTAIGAILVLNENMNQQLLIALVLVIVGFLISSFQSINKFNN